MNARQHVTALLMAAAPVSAASAAAPQWMLMSRHGECAAIASLERKIPDLGEVRDPEAFAKLMRERGYTVFTKGQSSAAGRSVEVLVPAKELSLVFVTAEMCRPAR